MKKNVVAVIDTGLTSDFLKNRVIGGFTLSIADGDINIERDVFKDDNMHGTMCCTIISQISPSCSFFVVKIMNENGKSNSLLLTIALEELLNYEIDYINISLSTNNVIDLGRLKTAINQHSKRGTVIISSIGNPSSNSSMISYPAMLNNVLAVKSMFFCNNSEDYKVDQKKSIIYVNGDPGLVNIDGEYRFFLGNSKATSVLTGVLSKGRGKYSVEHLYDWLLLNEVKIPSVNFSFSCQDFAKSYRGIQTADEVVVTVILESIKEIIIDFDVNLLLSGAFFMDALIQPNDCIEIYRRACNRLSKKYNFESLQFENVLTIYTMAKYISQQAE